MEWWSISNGVITETHRNFNQTTRAADSRCCHYFMKMIYFYLEQLQGRSSNSPLPGVCHLHQTDTCCGKVGQIPHYCKNQGHKVVSSVGERSTEAKEPSEQTLGSKSTLSEVLCTSQNSAFPSCREEPHSRAEPNSGLPSTRARTDCEYSDSNIQLVKLWF